MSERSGVLMTPRAVVSRRREFFPTSHSDLRVTWHPEADTLVLTLWSGGRCTGSAPLGAADAGRLTAFITCRLAERATTPLRKPSDPTDVLGAARGLARAVRRRWGDVFRSDSPR
jgi:hypothetical protein